MTTIHIQGMSCGHCAASVQKALEELGLTEVRVDAAKGEAVFAGSADQEALRRAIAAKGYQLVD
ncbi:MAG: heavy-metal-associated domain-containing protein [Desulfobulbus sp.]|jgi:copper chaperone CopZ|nr:heavy-metal-associated domain-containing protein [Desulfobulbus sp.]